ncbi:polyhydroxyalkanoate synthesis repressor PhaR [Methylovirgula sp. 4M-Z18]|uniref:polyhydroxyalkanoate synthesis repressor PhaR n=1 Tax=Methylovirgula sp. 4M-Z18 TaxID=2293567 RepID=UPI000E2FCE6E|nr:polyhydroxyalkanoate synthesis repressor PhaR [Methylovirgula sp. 4M-Z18]RFB78547.1 polyhydroxyalkanoate synthesis repressor PhaR [Methylovirgula sp. 4M-Z18]
MSSEKSPIVIKKYANRRLYNTGTSTYVTLEDLSLMVKAGEDFLVYDAKTNEDITRSVLTQIIFEQESKDGQSLLPITFLRQLIRFYGDQMQALVPSYLQFSIERLVSEQQKFRDQVTSTFGTPMFGPIEEQARKNMAMFNQALAMFNPFNPAAKGASTPTTTPAANGPDAAKPGDELDELKKQMSAMQKRLDSLSGSGGKR